VMAGAIKCQRMGQILYEHDLIDGVVDDELITDEIVVKLLKLARRTHTMR
jgi:hypothetical protein